MLLPLSRFPSYICGSAGPVEQSQTGEKRSAKIGTFWRKFREKRQVNGSGPFRRPHCVRHCACAVRACRLLIILHRQVAHTRSRTSAQVHRLAPKSRVHPPLGDLQLSLWSAFCSPSRISGTDPDLTAEFTICKPAYQDVWHLTQSCTTTSSKD